MSWVLLRRSILSDDAPSLPRPKIVQQVLHIGPKEECREKLDEIRLKPENESTEYIEVDLSIVRYSGQKTYNSKEVTKDNGKRNTNC
jgi:hypothetical protein